MKILSSISYFTPQNSIEVFFELIGNFKKYFSARDQSSFKDSWEKYQAESLTQL